MIPLVIEDTMWWGLQVNMWWTPMLVTQHVMMNGVMFKRPVFSNIIVLILSCYRAVVQQACHHSILFNGCHKVQMNSYVLWCSMLAIQGEPFLLLQSTTLRMIAWIINLNHYHKKVVVAKWSNVLVLGTSPSGSWVQIPSTTSFFFFFLIFLESYDPNISYFMRNIEALLLLKFKFIR